MATQLSKWPTGERLAERIAVSLRGAVGLLAGAHRSGATHSGPALDQTSDLLHRTGEPLIQATELDDLFSGDRDVRRVTAWMLGSLGDRGALPALTAALHDSDADVRYAVAEAIGKLRDPAGAGALAEALDDDVIYVRYAAASALMALGDPRGRQALQNEEVWRGPRTGRTAGRAAMRLV